jgi:peptide/nickel transport system substrate-binding protein
MTKYVRTLKVFILIGVKYLRRKIKLVSVGFLIVLSVIFLLIKFSPALRNTTSISEGIIGTYQEHDLPETVTRLLSEGLIDTDPSGRVLPKLVSGWEVNNDATIFKFKLKDNLKWNDGTPVRSQDLEYSIADVEVTYPDEKTIQFKLKDSFSPFPSLLGKPVFKKGGYLIGVGKYNIDKCSVFFVFSKPCIFKSRVFITKIILEPTSPDLPKVNLRFYPSEKIAQTALSLGEVQGLLGVSELPKDTSPVVTYTQKQAYNRVIAVLYNTQDSILTNRSLRQALSYSIPKIEGELAAKGPIPPTSWVFNSEMDEHIGNTEAAKSALARARQNLNPDDLKKEIVLICTPQYEVIGKEIVLAWQNLGLKAVLRVESGIPQNFQALLTAQSLTTDPDQYALWHSTQSKSNLTKYSSARIDKDLEDGRKTTEEEERKAKYLDFQRVLMEDAPAAFLYYPKYNVVYFKKIEENLNKILPLQLPG